MTFLFVHGALHGAWCWTGVLEELKFQGYEANAIDLPGHGDDVTPRNSISQKQYAERIVNYVLDNNLNDVVLVGHSAAGASLTLVSPQLNERLRKVIFLAAIVPFPGESIFDHIPSERREGYIRSAKESEDNSFSAKYKVAREIFFEDSNEDEARRLFKKLTPEPFSAYCEPVRNQEFFESLPPRDYLLCSLDRALPPEKCFEWSTRLETKPKVIEAGHCVMISQPELLVKTILTCLS